MESGNVESGNVDSGNVDAPENEEDDDDKLFGTCPDHVVFIKMIRTAKEEADACQTKVPVTWRGYKTSVLPNMPPLTEKALRDRLIWALRGIFNLRTEEKEVILFISNNYQ